MSRWNWSGFPLAELSACLDGVASRLYCLVWMGDEARASPAKCACLCVAERGASGGIDATVYS